MSIERHDIVVIGAGQAGLSAGHYLAKLGMEFVILEAADRIGESWRRRWDSLRLFTPASLNGLPGLRFPGDPEYFPTKDEMADYLERYARHFDLPVLLRTRVDGLTRTGDRYLIAAGTRCLEARGVVVATGAYATPRFPTFAEQLDPAIRQIRSHQYRDPGQLRDGPVLVVGAGNSGAEIALELAATHETWLSGRDTGNLPLPRGVIGYWMSGIVYRSMALLTIDTWPGRWLSRKGREFAGGHPLIGIGPEDFVRAGVRRVGRTTGVRDGRPALEDGRVLDVRNVVWCTGFLRDDRWIRLPVFDARGDPVQRRGVVEAEPGLYFLGLPFQSSLVSDLVGGVGRDARHVVRQIAARHGRVVGR